MLYFFTFYLSRLWVTALTPWKSRIKTKQKLPLSLCLNGIGIFLPHIITYRYRYQPDAMRESEREQSRETHSNIQWAYHGEQPWHQDRINLPVFFPEERGIAFITLSLMTHRVIMIAFFLLWSETFFDFKSFTSKYEFSFGWDIGSLESLNVWDELLLTCRANSCIEIQSPVNISSLWSMIISATADCSLQIAAWKLSNQRSILNSDHMTHL